jgi:diguanylate cyclase (GGDEF)-like protein
MILETATGVLSTCCAVNFAYNKSLKADNHTDQLTGLLNRKFLKNLESMEKSGTNFYVIGCDIDHFKSVNDTYGHSTGDIVLKAFATNLKNMFKGSSDYVVRFGGEEFFIFSKQSPKYTEDIVFSRVEETRKKIEALEILSTDNELIKITVSFGISYNNKLSLQEKIEDSDKKLYEAKETGRNKVII